MKLLHKRETPNPRLPFMMSLFIYFVIHVLSKKEIMLMGVWWVFEGCCRVFEGCLKKMNRGVYEIISQTNLFLQTIASLRAIFVIFTILDSLTIILQYFNNSLQYF